MFVGGCPTSLIRRSLPDFVDADGRHWDDAELLFANRRWASADQMYGFSAECGLKAVMLSLGMPVDDTGKPIEREHQEHVPRIWRVFEDFVSGRSGERYVRILPADEPFGDWSHHNRYAHRQHFNRADVARHRKAARGVRGLVQRLTEDRADE